MNEFMKNETADSFLRSQVQDIHITSFNTLYELTNQCVDGPNDGCGLLYKILDPQLQADFNAEYIVQRWSMNENYLIYQTDTQEPFHGGEIHIVNLKANNIVTYVSGINFEIEFNMIKYHEEYLLIASENEIRTFKIEKSKLTSGALINISNEQILSITNIKKPDPKKEEEEKKKKEEEEKKKNPKKEEEEKKKKEEEEKKKKEEEEAKQDKPEDSQNTQLEVLRNDVEKQEPIIKPMMESKFALPEKSKIWLINNIVSTINIKGGFQIFISVDSKDSSFLVEKRLKFLTLPENQLEVEFQEKDCDKRKSQYRDLKIKKIDYGIDEKRKLRILLLMDDGSCFIYDTSNNNYRVIHKARDETFTDISVTFGNQICWQVEKDKKSTVWISYNTYDKESANIKEVQNEKIKHHAQSLVKQILFYQDILFVCHTSYVSIYDINTKSWIQHQQFKKSEIISIFEQKGVYIILKDGSIYKLSSRDIETGQVMYEELKFSKPVGLVLQVFNDETIYILSAKDDQLILAHWNENQFIQIEGLPNLDQNTQILPVSGNSMIVLIQNEKLSQYEVKSNKATKLRTVLFGVERLVKCMMTEDQQNLILSDSKNVFLIHLDTNQMHLYGFGIDKNAFLDKDGQLYYQYQDYIESRDLKSLLVDPKNPSPSLAIRTDIMANINTTISYIESFQKVCIMRIPLNPNDEFTITCIPSFTSHKQKLLNIPKLPEILATKQINEYFYVLTKSFGLLKWNVLSGESLQTGKCYVYKNNASPSKKEKFPIFLLTKEMYSEFSHLHNPCVGQNNIFPKLDKNLIFRQLINDEEFTVQRIKLLNQDRPHYEYKIIEILEEKNEIYIKEHNQFILDTKHSTDKNDKLAETWLFDIKFKLMLRRFPLEKQAKFYEIIVDDKWQIEFKLKHTIYDYPECLNYNNAFSPGLINYLEATDILEIKSIYKEIQPYIVPIDETVEDDLQKFYSRIEWLHLKQLSSSKYSSKYNLHLKIVSREGIERIFELQQNKDGRFKSAIRGLTELAFNVIPMFKDDIMYLDKGEYTYYDQRCITESMQSSDAIIRRNYQAYKSYYHLYFEGLRCSAQKQPYYSVKYDYAEETYATFKTLTYQTLKNIEMISSGKLPLECFSNTELGKMSQVILPSGNTLIHILAQNSSDMIQYVYMRSQSDQNKLQAINFEIAFIKNLEQKSPMHLLQEVDDTKTMNLLLKYLSGYGFDHHSRSIVEVFPYILRQKLPEFPTYIESRQFETVQTKRISQGIILKGSQGVSRQSYLFELEELNDLIDADNTQKRNINLKIFDLPYHGELADPEHLKAPIHGEFYQALDDCQWNELYMVKGIQKLVEHQFYKVQSITVQWLFFPFVIFHLCFVLYFNIVYETRNQWGWMNSFCQSFLSIMAIYFLGNELYQIQHVRLRYFAQGWNYIDLGPPVLILWIFIEENYSNQLSIQPKEGRALLALCTFLMWIKVLYFLRIFKTTGYLIRMIISVATGMRTFILIVVVTLAAFGDAMLRISLGNQDDPTAENNPRFANDFGVSLFYVYRIILGDFDTKDFGSIDVMMMYTLFILCTVFNTIIMLNLLISIISDLYAQSQSNSSLLALQEMASIYAENHHLMPTAIKQVKKANQYLVIATYTDEQAQNKRSDELVEIQGLKNDLGKQTQDIASTDERIKNLESKMDTILQLLQKKD